MKKSLLLSIAIIVATVLAGAGCNQELTPATDSSSPSTNATYGTVVEMWFEGWDRLYYEVTHPTSFTAQGKNPVALEDKNTGTKMTIWASSEEGRGYSPADYWENKKPCPDCQKRANTVSISSASEMITYGNANKEYILFDKDWLFVVETVNPTATSRQILETLTTEDPEKSPNFMKIKTALVVYEQDISAGKRFGKKIGCNDQIILEERLVRKTPQPLNAALKELFSLNEQHMGESYLQGILETHNTLAKTNLKFDHATMENGTAKIYLTGEVSGLGGVCDQPRVPAQIEETAKQFSTVKKVETYINGEVVDWSELFERMNRG